MFCFSANFRPKASARLLTTTAISQAGLAETIASKLLPRPEIKIAIFFMITISVVSDVHCHCVV